MTEHIRYAGRVIILDSGFCVLLGLIALLNVGIYASAVVKKRRYWPAFVDGDEIKNHMAGKDIGSVDCRHGTLNGKEFCLFAMNENKYSMILISTYGALVEVAGSIAKCAWKRDRDIEPGNDEYMKKRFYLH
mgnify:FL=1